MKYEQSRREGSTCLRSYGICAADDLSHYDVTSEPVREIAMAAKRWHQKSCWSDDCSKDLKESDQQTAEIKWPVNIVSKNTLVFKTRYRKAQKQAQFRDRSIENAIEKGSVVPVSWAKSGERNDELHEHKNMILIWFESFEWWWKRIIKHMHKSDQCVLTHTFVNDSVGLWRTCWSNYTRNPRNMRKYLAENVPLQRQMNYQFICWVGK